MIKRINTILLILWALLMAGSIVAQAADIQAQLDSNNGTSGFSVQNSSSAQVSRIDSNGNLTAQGNVGVGTSSTLTLLYVSPQGITPTYVSLGDTYLQNNLEVGGTAYFNNVQVDGMLSATGLHFSGQQSLDSLTVADNTFLAITTGNVGIGTSASVSKLTVDGGVSVGTGLSYLNTPAPANGLMVQGNVGIGSLAPGQALDVQGEIRTVNLAMSGQTPVAGYVLTASDSSGDTTWSTPGGVSGWTILGNNVYETGGGNVGIGTTTLTQGALVVTNGNVGIGTWAPSNLLTVGNNSFTVGSSGAIATSGGYTQSGSSINAFTGNVGIASTAPGETLDVQGTLRTINLTMSGQTPISGYILTATDSAGDTTWSSAALVGGWTVSGNDVFETNSGNVGIGTSTVTQGALVVTNGNVGIGTWAPSNLLTVGNNSFTVNSAGTITTATGIVTSGPYTQSGTGINAFTGNVGIASTAPGETLDVQGTLRTINLTMSGQTPISGYILTATDSAGDTTWSSAALVGGWTVSGNNVFETNNGNVGIGTSTVTQGALVVTNGNVGIGTWAPSAPLTVGANNFTVNSDGSIATTGGYTQSGNGTNLLTGTSTFNAPGTSAAFINNVGIGSTAPGETLDIQGTLRTINLTMSGQTPISGFILTATDSAGDTTWSSPSLVGGWTVSGNNVFETNSGNVGIGTSTVTEGALVVTNGNVGIGTWAPSAPLTVGANNFTVNSDGSIATTGGYTQSGNGTNLLTGTSTFNAPGTSAAFINNVGIGSTAPGETLDIQGTLRTINLTMSGQTPISGFILTATDSAGDTTWSSPALVGGWTVSGNDVFETNSGNVGIGTSTVTQGALVVTNGNVGIGTWAPSNLLTVGNNAFTVNSAGTITTATGIITSGPYTQSGTGINAFTGNVGIASTAPGETLDVQGTLRTINLTMSGQTPISGFILTATDSAGDTTWSSPALVGGWTVSGNDVFETNSGNVGIGTSTVTQGALVVTNGNVGIGTWTPSAPLTVGANNFTVNSNGSIATTGGYTQSGNGTNLLTGTSTFNAPGTSAAFINNVGIGSTAPGQALDVQGTIRTTGLAMSGQTPISGYILTASDSAGDTTWSSPALVGGWTVSGNDVFETNSGNVGIGTSTVTQGALVVTNGNVGIGTWAPADLFQVGKFSSSSSGLEVDNNGNVGIGTTLTAASSLSVMNGNVGIGTWVPNAVVSLGSTMNTIKLAVWDGGPAALYGMGVNAGALTFGANISENGTPQMVMTPAGNVGIGTITPGSNLSVLGGTSLGSYVNLAAPAGGIIASGNVGIGSTTPGQALDVQGTIRTTGLAMSGQTPISGYILTASDSAGDTTWSSPALVGGWTVSGNNVFETNSGNVGIGTSTVTQGALVVTNGNVGIGTWAPSAPLTVGANNFTVNSNGSIATTGGYTQSGNGTNLLTGTSTFNAPGTSAAFINNVGIGSTAPGQALDVQGTIRTTGLAMSGQTPISGYILTASDSAGDTTWSSPALVGGWTVSGNDVFETNSGNVGIGTSALQTALAVTNGNVGIGTWTAAGGNLIVNGGGNVGIGSAWPGQLLDVNGGIRTTTTGGVTFGTDNKALIQPSATTTPDLKFLTNNVEIMRITNGGNVGIGSTAPGQKLDVQGTIRTTAFAMSGQTPISGYILTASDSAGDTTWASLAAAGGWTVSGNNVYETSSGNVGIGTSALQTALSVTNGNVGIGTWTADGGNLIVNGGGNVGIGSAWPGQLLDVNGGIRTTTTGGVTFGTDNKALIQPSATTTPDLKFLTNNAEIMRITNGGNVGIGSTAPGQKLDVQGTIRTTAFEMSGQTPISGYILTASDSAGDTTWSSPALVGGWTVSGNNVFETNSGNVGIGTSALQTALAVTNGNVGIGTWTAAGGNLIVNGGGNVGIGSAWPGQLLDVNGGIRTTTTGGVTFGTDNKAIIQPSATTTPDLKFLTNNAEIMRITNGGNVGIGSTVPGQKLDVQGTIRTTALAMSGQTPISGYILTASDSAGDTTWSSPALVGGWTVSGNNVFETNSGNVGIGTTTVTQGALVVTNGNVGIGTWAPSNLLAVGNNAFTVSGSGAIATSGGYTQSGNSINAFTGNIGIGSTTPGQILDVQGTIRTTGFTMSGQTPISGYILTATDSAGDTAWGSLAAAGGWTVSGNNVYETSSGNVGIGTSALQTALAVTNGNVGIGTWTAAGGNLIVNGGGNVGIGSAWPGQLLDVNGGIRTTTTGGVTFGTDNKALIQPSATTTPDLKFLTNNAEIMRITNGGNVGIGSTAPGQKLDVQGTIRTTAFEMSGQTPISGYILTATDSAGDTTWASLASAGGWTVSGNNVYETSSGNVGIGTSALQTALAVTNGNVGIGTWTAAGGNLIVNGGGNVGIGSAWPGQLLDVNGGIRTTTTGGVTFGTDNKAIIQPSATTTPDLKFLTNNAEIMRITNGGNVGIGSTVPGQKLDVQGTIRTTALAMSGQTPISGYILTASDSAGDTTWSSPALVGGWTVSGNNVFETNSGNVGIGTTTVTQGALVVTNGNVGIGTWAPSNLLAVGNNAFTVNSAGTITTATGIVTSGPYTQSGTGINVFTGIVGIGSTTPGQELDVQGTIRTTGFTMSGQTPISGYILTATDSAGDTTWASLASAGGWTVSGNNVYETSSGNVGIGTSALQTALAVTNGNVGIGTWTAAGGNLIVNGGGNVGIGSAWPGQLLDVNGGIRTTTAGGVTFGTDNKAIIQPSATTTPDLKFLTNNAEIMRITNGGNVGIGSTAPGQKLDVQGTIRTTAFEMSGQTPISGYILTATDSAGDTTWASLASAGGWTVSGNNVYETSSGNVGIGTSALQTALAVTNGNVGIGTWTAAGGNLIVNGGGNVGIGSAWPGQMLDVTGTVRDLGLIVNGNVGIGTSALQTAFAVTNGNVGIGTWTSSSTFSIIGSIAVHTVTETAVAAPVVYTAGASDQVIIANATGNSVTIDLPPVSSVPGREYIIKRTDSTSNTVIIQANAAETIDGQNTVSLTIQYQSYAIVSDGTQWNII